MTYKYYKYDSPLLMVCQSLSNLKMNNFVVTFAVSRRFSSMERAGKVDPQERLHLSPYQQAGLTRCAIYQMIHRPQCTY